MLRRRPTALLLMGLAGCLDAADPTPMDPEPAEPAPQALVHDFPTVTVDPGQERNFICQSWTLNNDEPLYVNAVSLTAGPGWHHSNWLFAPETDFAGPDDTWSCADRGFELLEAGISGGVIYTQSPEVTGEVQRFGAGAAVVIPPRSKIIAELHFLNVSDEVLTTHGHLEFDLLPPDDVTTLLAGLALSYYPLALPPSSPSEFTAECDLARAYGGPLDFRVHYIAPHYHALGQGMRVESFDGAGNRAMIYETARHIGEPLAFAPDEPVALAGSAGIRFTCRYDNPRPETVGFGSSERDEMCVLFAFTDSPVRFVGGVLPMSDNVAVEGSDPAMPAFASTCQVVALGP